MEEEKITLNPDGKVFYLEQHKIGRFTQMR